MLSIVQLLTTAILIVRMLAPLYENREMDPAHPTCAKKFILEENLTRYMPERATDSQAESPSDST